MESKSPERKFLTFAICFALVTDIHLMSGRMIFQSIDIAHKFSYDSRPYDSDARSIIMQVAGARCGPVANFSDQCASGVRRRDGLTFGCGSGFQTPVFLSIVVPMQVRQS